MRSARSSTRRRSRALRGHRAAEHPRLAGAHRRRRRRHPRAARLRREDRRGGARGAIGTSRTSPPIRATGPCGARRDTLAADARGAPRGGAPLPHAGHAAHRRARGRVAVGSSTWHPPRAVRALRPAGGRARPPVSRDAVGGVSLGAGPPRTASTDAVQESGVLPPSTPRSCLPGRARAGAWAGPGGGPLGRALRPRAVDGGPAQRGQVARRRRTARAARGGSLWTGGDRGHRGVGRHPPRARGTGRDLAAPPAPALHRGGAAELPRRADSRRGPQGLVPLPAVRGGRARGIGQPRGEEGPAGRHAGGLPPHGRRGRGKCAPRGLVTPGGAVPPRRAVRRWCRREWSRCSSPAASRSGCGACCAAFRWTGCSAG